MNVLKLTILEVTIFPKRPGIVASADICPATSGIPSSIVFRDQKGGRWQVIAIANSDPPPAPGWLMVTLSSVGGQRSLEEGMELEQER